jgi:hypothetical protein
MGTMRSRNKSLDEMEVTIFLKESVIVWTRHKRLTAESGDGLLC